ncbi:MAG: endonuclease V [Conexivisphaera sp.]
MGEDKQDGSGHGGKLRFSTERAKAAQVLLSSRVSVPRGRSDVRLVAGLDVAYACGSAFGAAALVDIDGPRVVERAVSELEERIPYIPGFLAFREAGPMITALRRLRYRPDALMVNGHGIAHPRRFGIASHIGVVLGIKSIGIAKSRLMGEEVNGSLIMDGEEVARILRSGRMKIYVSVGHGISLEEAVRLTEATLTETGKLPLPVQEAHNTATEASRECYRGRIRTSVPSGAE